MISQTAHFPGLTPQRLYEAFLSAEDHAAMTADGRQCVSYQGPDGTPADGPQAGDRLLASNIAGAEIRLDQAGVPAYEVYLPDTGERGPLENIVNTHWNLGLAFS